MSRIPVGLAAALFGLGLISPALAADPVAASVNGVEIKLSDVERTRNGTPQLAQAPLKIVYPMLLDNLINEVLLAEAGRKDGLAKDPEVVAAMKEAETRLIARTYALRSATKSVTDQMVKDRYEQFKKANPPGEEVRARHILLESEDAAKKVAADLKKGRKFEDLAKEMSKDNNGENGGDLGYFRKEEMVAEFSEAAFKLKPGQVSPPVKTQFGWHVIKSEDKRIGKSPELAEIKEDLKAQLAQESLGKIIQNLTSGAKISRFDLEGKPMAPPPPASHGK
ncbi:MAG: peptidylprolyl isomerase [Alphaproteobacteria bacterium]|nr:peptidylprolyl isomerase [Alphaproteobacteria bacterium]